MRSASIGRRLEAELGTIAERCGCELLATRFAGNVLRLVVDRSDVEGGVTIKDCERVSRETSALLDVEDFASGQYVLEVSSPGLDREFYRESDYERFGGQQIKVTWRDPATGSKRTDLGVLESAQLNGDKHFVLATTSEPLTIHLKDVIKTRLDPEF